MPFNYCLFLFLAGDVGNEKWRSSLRSNHNHGGYGGHGYNNNPELLPYDQVSLSSYGSHKNRTFNVGSHAGSLHSFHETAQEVGDVGAIAGTSRMLNNRNRNNRNAAAAASVKRSVHISDDPADARSISPFLEGFIDAAAAASNPNGLAAQPQLTPEEEEAANLAAQARLEAEILEATTQELMMQEYPADCCPDRCYAQFPCLGGDHDSPFWQGWGSLRIKTFRLIENKYFETAVIAMILISSLALVSHSLPFLCVSCN